MPPNTPSPRKASFPNSSWRITTQLGPYLPFVVLSQRIPPQTCPRHFRQLAALKYSMLCVLFLIFPQPEMPSSTQTEILLTPHSASQISPLPQSYSLSNTPSTPPNLDLVIPSLPWAQYFFYCHPLQVLVLCFSLRLSFLKVHMM